MKNSWKLYPYNDPACHGTGKVTHTPKGFIYGEGEDCPHCWGTGLSVEALYTLSAVHRHMLREKMLSKAEIIRFLPERLR